MQTIEVHMLWVSGELSALEMLCIGSFVRQGYNVSLWTYGGVTAYPQGVVRRDAREVLPESALFLNQHGSYAGFSDLFRYAVLRMRGGLYSDVDVLALRPAAELPPIPFLVTERTRQGGKINGNIIHSPQPHRGDVIDLAFAYASVFPKQHVVWSEIGPSLLTAIVGIHPAHGFQIMSPDFANPVDWWDCPAKLLADLPVPAGFFLHLYNDMWRRTGTDKNLLIAANTLLGRAARA